MKDVKVSRETHRVIDEREIGGLRWGPTESHADLSIGVDAPFGGGDVARRLRSRRAGWIGSRGRPKAPTALCAYCSQTKLILMARIECVHCCCCFNCLLSREAIYNYWLLSSSSLASIICFKQLYIE